MPPLLIGSVFGLVHKL